MIKIITATKKDSKKILEYYIYMYVKQRQFAGFYAPSKNYLSACKKIVKQMFYKRDFIYKAVSDGKIAGFVDSEIKAWPEYRDKEFYVKTLFVDPTFRGQGIGTKLLAKSIELARKKKIKWIGLSTDVRNKCAKSLYEKMGFETHRIVLKKRV